MKIVSTVRVSLKGLTANKLRTFFMMLGVLIGITALTVIVSVGQGAKVQVMQKMENLSAFGAVMVVPGGGMTRGLGSVDAVPATLTAEDAQAIQAEVPNVQDVALVQSKQGMSIKFGGQSTTTMVWGVTPNYPTIRPTPVARGEFFGVEEQSSQARVAVLGQDTAAALFGDADPLEQTIRIEHVPFKVIGLQKKMGASPGGGNLDDRVLIPQGTAARRLFNLTNMTQLVVQIKGREQVRGAAERVKQLLHERHHIAPGMPDDFSVRIAEQMLGILTGTSQTLTLFLSIVAALSLLVGGFIVMNIMLISVSERTKEIGLRRAVGARRRDILLQFVLEAGAVTAAGGLIGVLLGAGGALLASHLIGWPAAISWPAIVGAVLFAGFVGLIFGVQPARKAASLHPVEALRG
ncbi:MAG: ABC transporter permease [candidate division NC10 bacterium]|nr:ABC transporter permease [candidate division NC10 bacterium]MBI2457020.1 ABC transporter permease [candidate division NC10 bacterium]MBI3121414.1 ABC transporter permease [candidate division NC10 bacterium]